MDLLEILQVYRIRQHNSTCVQNLETRTMAFVGKTRAIYLYKCIDDFSIRDNTIYQLGYN